MQGIDIRKTKEGESLTKGVTCFDENCMMRTLEGKIKETVGASRTIVI